MMAVLFILLCSCLISAGVALECEVCSSSSGNTCSGRFEICKDPESRCLVTLTETSFGQEKSAVLTKACGSLYNCTHPVSLRANGYRVRVSANCCATNYCNKGTVPLVTPNSTLNELSCPSCFAKDPESCDPHATVNCTGKENHCVLFSVSKERGSTIRVAGCASDIVIQSQGKAAFRGSSINVYNFSDGNSGETLRQGSLLIPLTLLTVMKIVAL
ncbi:phospholipase A2 inhibitor and Ly6/PLAUR domain-containing protein [Xenopus laevis]|uniref:Phospholipase A2 inhibitor and Ly6/PLAUR domain-containing protein n=1 Tax=Xenopus laevis TaxID=8355 RepID=A0A8J1LDK8_XENLA|nr:phospholipase A2 inhibitor and Ly6/PLAUR domain-containing protein [Xenopus laevis]